VNILLFPNQWEKRKRERAGEALLFCPIESPPRNRVVRLDDAGLERGGPEENMFAPLDSSVKQSGGER
jgi:hypothetical protein